MAINSSFTIYMALYPIIVRFLLPAYDLHSMKPYYRYRKYLRRFVIWTVRSANMLNTFIQNKIGK